MSECKSASGVAGAIDIPTILIFTSSAIAGGVVYDLVKSLALAVIHCYQRHDTPDEIGSVRLELNNPSERIKTTIMVPYNKSLDELISVINTELLNFDFQGENGFNEEITMSAVLEPIRETGQ